MPLYYFIDESGNDDSSNFFALVAVVLDDYQKLSKCIKDEEEKIKNSIYFCDRFDSFKNFHACDDNLDIKSRLIESIRPFNYRAYFIIIDKNKSDFKNKQKFIYNTAIKYLFKNILIKNREKDNYIYFEECSIMKLNDYEKIIEELSSKINKKYSINSIIHIDIKKKTEESLLAIADYMLYILQKIYKVDSPQDHVIKQYNNIVLDKIGMIHDLCDKKFYNRKRPFKIIK